MQNELELLRTFRSAAESTSFREAAIRLGSSPQGVTRAIRVLERHYGEMLFHRSTRQVRITAFGEALLKRIRPTLDQFEELWQPTCPERDEAVTGIVRVSAPHSLGTRTVLPALQRVARRHPAITLDVRLSDRISDAVDEGIDVGVRVGFMHGSRFVARQAANMSLYTVAAPELIARLGEPADIDALGALPITASLDINTGRPWPWYFKAGRQWSPTSPTFIADDADMEMGAVLAGIAFGQLADYMAVPYIAEGRLVRVLRDVEPAAWGLYVYRPQRGPVPARIRAVFDELHAAVATLPSLEKREPPPTADTGT